MENTEFENELKNFQEVKKITDKQLNFLSSICCLKSKVETEIYKGKSCMDSLEEITEPYFRYLDMAEDISNVDNFKNFIFNLEEIEAVDSPDNVEEIMSSVRFPMLLEALSKLPELDINKYHISVFEKNSHRNYILKHGFDFLNLEKFFTYFNLTKHFEIVDNIDFKKELIECSISLCKSKIEEAEKSIVFYREQLEKAKQDLSNIIKE